ncbi:hypothetical protein CLBKND_04199 [Methylorubrum aminovorans]
MSDILGLIGPKGGVLTMSSIDIADLTGKRHDNVVRNIRVLFQQLGIGQSKFGSSYLAQNEKMEPCFHLPYDETMALITGYSVPLRMAVAGREAIRRSSDAMPSSTSAGTSRIDRESSSRGTSIA